MQNWKEITNSKDLQPDEVNYVIYHNPCSDGTGSGYIAWKYLKSKYPYREVIYKPMSIGSDPPNDIDGKNVLICDYSFKKEKMNKLLLRVNKLLIIDHHKSAEADLKDLDDKYKIFDMGHSGAMLTWFYFFPGIEPPLMIKYIEDRDIWAKKLPFTDEFTAWFYTLPLNFEEYDKYNDDDLIKDMIKVKGSNFIELNNYYVLQALDHASVKFTQIKDKFYIVAYVNSTVLKSDIGNKLLEKYPYIDFSAVYSISDTSTSFSLRSDDTHIDVASLAFSLGGGGHRNASGVNCYTICNHLPGNVFEYNKLHQFIESLYFDSVDIDGHIYWIVYLHSPTHKYKLGLYLLQQKYRNKNNDWVQVCQDIFNKKNCVTDFAPVKYKISAVWDYDPLTNCTYYSLVFDRSLTADEKNAIYKKLQTVNHKIVYTGLQKSLQFI